MKHPFIYIGCFIKDKEFAEILQRIPSNRLDRIIDNPHVTFAYRPEKVDESLFGEEVKIKVVGYGNNDENEGVKVELFTSNTTLQNMIDGIGKPHITISVSKKGKAVNTKQLDFCPINSFEINGKFGGYTQWKKVITKYKKG